MSAMLISRTRARYLFWSVLLGGSLLLVGPTLAAQTIEEVMEAIAKKDVAAVEKLLAGNKALLNARTTVQGRGWEMLGTPLHAAVMFENKEIVKLLLSKDARVNEVDESGCTPLHLASWKGSKEIVALLLTVKDIDVNALTTSPRQTALHYALDGFPLSQTPLEHKAAICDMLLKKGANANLKNGKGVTVLQAVKALGEEKLLDVFKDVRVAVAPDPPPRPDPTPKPEPTPRPQPGLKDRFTVTFELKPIILVKGKINDAEGLFVFDTGASHNVLTPAAAQAAGVTPSGQFGTCTLGVGEGILTEQRVAVQDMPQLRPLKTMFGIDYSGVLGYPYISRFVTTFDFRFKRLTFATADTAPPLKATPGSSLVPFTLNPQANLIFIKARVNGAAPMLFLFDSGAQETFLTPAAAKKLGLGSGRASLKSVTIGDAEANDITALIADPPQAQMLKLIGQHYDGILGRTFFQQFIITLDYRSKQLRLTPYTI